MAVGGTSGIIIAFCTASFAQQPAFEAASIKPAADAPGSPSGIFSAKGRISARNVTLKRCIRGAYDVQESRILGGPKWAGEDRFSIEAKAAGPAGDRELMRMLQTLLAERFRLVFHRERRTTPGYRMVPGKGGLKAGAAEPGSGSDGTLRRGGLDAAGYTMAQLAMKLSEVLHIPVEDATGVAGRFDFKLEWAPVDMQARPPSGDQPAGAASEAGAGPSLFAALEEQLGLKLESGRNPAEVLVIDSAEKPSEN